MKNIKNLINRLGKVSFTTVRVILRFMPVQFSFVRGSIIGEVSPLLWPGIWDMPRFWGANLFLIGFRPAWVFRIRQEWWLDWPWWYVKFCFYRRRLAGKQQRWQGLLSGRGNTLRRSLGYGRKYNKPELRWLETIKRRWLYFSF